MTTTDINSLQNRIARVLATQDGFGPEHPDHEIVTGEWFSVAAAVLPIVEAEVRAAKAEALREAAKAHEAEGLDVNTESMPHHDGWSYVTVSQWLRIRATEYETGDPR